MREYTVVKETVEKKYLKTVICDVCKKPFNLSTDDWEIFEAQEFFSIGHNCGWGSVFGDGDRIEIDICQHCFKKLLGDYARLIPEEA